MTTRVKIIRWASGFFLVLGALTLPFLFIATLFALAGSAPAYYYLLIGLGYLSLMLSLVFIRRKPETRIIYIVLMFLIPAGLIFTGLHLDERFWSKHNADLCSELRAEPSCNETACGFSCENFHGFGFATGAGICEDKDLTLCRPTTQ